MAAKKRKGAYSKLSAAGKKKFHTVMREYAEKRLRSSSGELVTDRSQALAIAFSEARSAH